MTSGLSPVALTQAHAGWAQHLLLSPDEQIELVHKAARNWARFFPYSINQPVLQDKRFAGQAWQHWPFKAFCQNFLLTQQWWHNSTTGVPGVSRHHEDIVSFLARQALDIVSPANIPFTNPEVIEKTAHQGGMNFVRGALNFWEDWQRICGGDGPVGSEAFKVGPGHPNRHHQIATHKETESYVDPDAWQASAVYHEGSWWPCWLDWLEHLSGTKSAPPPMGGTATAYASLCDAPGTYVLEP
jgi:Poly-beta-hydroxybutyrate polymerase (PhaC) N-terminus/Poly-beta-hydroxybutyrate polymerase N terminal